MRIGVIKEIKDQENRVALTPTGAHSLVQAGHLVMIQAGAGVGSGFTDTAFREAGASIVSVDNARDADLVLKVKEPLESEYCYLKEQLLFTYLHLAGVNSALTQALLRQKTTAVAYEAVEDAEGALPLLAPLALTTATLPYVLQLAQHGVDACHKIPGLAKGLNAYRGCITSWAVAEALHLTSQYQPFADF